MIVCPVCGHTDHPSISDTLGLSQGAERAIFDRLMSHRKASFDDLYNVVWDEAEGEGRPLHTNLNIKVHISRIRRKLEAKKSGLEIRSVYGWGYEVVEK